MIKSRKGQEGFTLIELLVVVLIIGILAAIAIPAFLGQKKGAQDASSKSLLRNSAVAMESYYADQQTFHSATDVLLKGFEPSVTWNIGAPADADAVGPTKDNEVDVRIPASATATQDYALYTKSASGRIFSYHRNFDASVVKCKAETTIPAVTSGGTPSKVTACGTGATTW